MLHSTLARTLCLAQAAYAATNSSAWSTSQFRSLVAFGDSYTDESRLGYFISHNGSAPPTGTLLPESFATADGGRIWARYVVQYTNQSTQLYDYAVSGAVCSNDITPRFFSAINANFPDIAGYEVPAFLADKASNVNAATGKPLFATSLTASNTVYAVWIGTNDLGEAAFIDNQEAPGASITDYLDCVYASLARLYAAGGRYFVLMNVAPLHLNAEYANASFGGVGANQYWTNKPSGNLRAIGERMRQNVGLVNDVYKYRTPYEVLVAGSFPGAQVALYDVNQLFLDIRDDPRAYLNGTAAPQINGFSHSCNVYGQNCTAAESPDSYLWYDELHPSEQTERMVAKYFVDVLGGSGKYATYYSGDEGGWRVWSSARISG